MSIHKIKYTVLNNIAQKGKIIQNIAIRFSTFVTYKSSKVLWE